MGGSCTGERPRRSGQEREGGHVARPHYGEVAAIDRGDLVDVQPLGGRDAGGVDGSKREVAIARDEFGDAQPVRGRDGLHAEITGGEVAEEAHLGLGTEPGREQASSRRTTPPSAPWATP